MVRKAWKTTLAARLGNPWDRQHGGILGRAGMLFPSVVPLLSQSGAIRGRSGRGRVLPRDKSWSRGGAPLARKARGLRATIASPPRAGTECLSTKNRPFELTIPGAVAAIAVTANQRHSPGMDFADTRFELVFNGKLLFEVAPFARSGRWPRGTHPVRRRRHRLRRVLYLPFVHQSRADSGYKQRMRGYGRTMQGSRLVLSSCSAACPSE